MGFNKVIMEGHLCRDVEIKYAQNTGKPYGRTSIAVNSVSGSAENRREDVCFLDIVLFGRTAEIAAQYCHKGSHVLLDGKLQYESWQNQNGENRYKHSMVVESLQMLDTKNSDPAGREQNSNSEFSKSSDPAGQGQNSFLENSNSEFSKNSAPAGQGQNSFLENSNSEFSKNDELPF